MSSIKSAATKAVTAVKTTVKKAANAVKTKVQTVVTKAKTTAQNVVNKVKETAKKATEAAKKVTTAAKTTVQKAVTKVTTAVKTVVEKASNNAAKAAVSQSSHKESKPTVATKGTSTSQTKTTGNPRKKVTPEAQKYAREESKKFYSGIGQSIVDTSKGIKDIAVGAVTLLVGPVEKKKEVLRNIKDTAVGIGYAVIHPDEVWESIKNIAEEKGGSYIAGYLGGEIMLAVAGGAAGKAASSVDDVIDITKTSANINKGRKSQQIVEKLRSNKTTKSTGKPEIGNKAVCEGNGISVLTQKNIETPTLPEGSKWERNVLNSFDGGRATATTYEGGTTLYRIGGKNGGFWSLEPPPATEYQWRVNFAIKQEFGNDASTLYKMTIPEGSSLGALEGKVGTQGMGLYGGAHQSYIDYRAVPSDWIEVTPVIWK